MVPSLYPLPSHCDVFHTPILSSRSTRLDMPEAIRSLLWEIAAGQCTWTSESIAAARCAS